MKQLFGTGVALVTPFKKDFSIDIEALVRIVNFCVDGDIDYLVILGTTGESISLNATEKELVINTIIEVNDGRLPLVLGVGGNNTASIVEEVSKLKPDSFEAILSVSPSYNKPTQEGIYQHFKAISKASPLPIILYNVPGRTGSNMLPATTLRLATDFENIVGIKEASGDIVQIMTLIKDKPQDFHVISGDDITALPTVLAGGSGVISVLGQGLPVKLSRMIRLGLEGRPDDAYQLHYEMQDLMISIFREGNPAGIKSIFEILGMANGTVRLPLVEATSDLKEKLKASLKSLVEVHT